MTTQFNAAARLGITVSKNARTAPKSQPRRFTDAFVRQLKPDRARRIEVCDALTTGLLLRATPNGFKTFALHTRAPSGKTMRITPGRYPGISLATARVGERAPRGHRARTDPCGDCGPSRCAS